MVYTLSGARMPSACKLGSNGRNSGFERSASVSFLKNKLNSRKVFAGKSYESRSQSSMAATSQKVLPGTKNDGSASPTEELEDPETVSNTSQIPGDIDSSETTHGPKVDDEENMVELPSSSEAITEEDSASVQLPDGDLKAKAEGKSESTYETISDESARIRGRILPPLGIGQKIYEIDPLLNNHREHLGYRYEQYRKLREAIDKNEGGLELFFSWI